MTVEVSPTSEQFLPLFNQAEALANGDRRFQAISQSGLSFTEVLSQMATVAIPYPARETAASIRVYALVENDWLRVEEVRVNKNQQAIEFKTDRLTL